MNNFEIQNLIVALTRKKGVILSRWENISVAPALTKQQL